MKIFFAGLALAVLLSAAKGEDARPVLSIPLGVEGRIDHMAFDAAGNRLFICALGNNSVEVVDLRQGKVVKSLSGFSEPQGVCFVPDFNLLAVANGGDGKVTFLDGTSFTSLSSLPLGDDADNMRYDRAHKSIIVGYGSGALAVIDPATRKVTARISLSGHPESFQIEKAGLRAYVNVPTAHTISVVDMEHGKTTGSFSLGQVTANFPMALDETGHRLFVACRVPSRLLVINTVTGDNVATLTLHGDCDDIFYDPSRKEIVASCGEGFLDFFSQSDADHYALKKAIATSPGARASYFDGESIYVAVPHRGGQSAELRKYRP